MLLDGLYLYNATTTAVTIYAQGIYQHDILFITFEGDLTLTHMAPKAVGKPSKCAERRSAPMAEMPNSTQSAVGAPRGGPGTPDSAMQTTTIRSRTVVLHINTSRKDTQTSS